MEKETILKSTINCGLELFIDELINDADNTVTYAFSNYIKDYFCNYVYVNKLKHFQIEKIEENFQKRGLVPTVYLADTQIYTFVMPTNYKKGHHDIWMSFDLNKELDEDKYINPELEIFSTNKNNKLETDFLNLFDRIYINNTSPEVYSNLDNGYIERLKLTMRNSPNTYFIIGYYKGAPVSIGSITIDGEIGGIYSDGTLKEYRGKGFGSSILNYRLKIAKNNGCTTAFLGTEKDSINHQHFKNFGFKDLFEGVCYYKSN